MTVVLLPLGENPVEVVSWVDALGSEHVLTEQAYWALERFGRTGWTIPSSRLSEQDLALQAGGVLLGVKDLTRPMDLPIFLQHPTAAGLRDLLRSFSRWFDPLAGDGYLRVDYGTSERQMAARPTGLIVPNSPESSGYSPFWQRVVASVEALHPYWRDPEESTISFVQGEGSGTFFPLLPIRLRPATLFSQKGATNVGDVFSWPVWTLLGPASDITLTNVTTGLVFALQSGYALREGETLTIDTRPLVRTVTDRSGNRIFGLQKAGSALWPLIYGVNDVRVQLGGTSTATLATMTWTPEYRAP